MQGPSVAMQQTTYQKVRNNQSVNTAWVVKAATVGRAISRRLLSVVPATGIPPRLRIPRLITVAHWAIGWSAASMRPQLLQRYFLLVMSTTAATNMRPARHLVTKQ
jgi:hypothetical protein